MFSITSRIELEPKLLLVGPGGRKFLNFFHGFGKLLAHNTAGEAELHHFSDLAEAAVLAFRTAFEEIIFKSTGKLHEVVLGFLQEDGTDYQIYVGISLGFVLEMTYFRI